VQLITIPLAIAPPFRAMLFKQVGPGASVPLSQGSP
jgi:hypothetical protein